MDHPLPWLRYVDAGDLDDTSAFDGLQVESPAGEDLGGVNGFILDTDSGRPLYVVVDSGGWFKSKYFLLPVGHARLDSDREALIVDIARNRIERFPGVDLDNFEKLSDTELKRLNDDICQACSIEGVSIAYAVSEPYSAAWDRPDFRYPDWWQAEPALPSRMGASAVTAGATPAQSFQTSTTEGPHREQVVGRSPESTRDQSPHFDGRAQPGDVIGVETGGERTNVGDTAEDETKRRRDAEETDAKIRRDERK